MNLTINMIRQAQLQILIFKVYKKGVVFGRPFGIYGFKLRWIKLNQIIA